MKDRMLHFEQNLTTRKIIFCEKSVRMLVKFVGISGVDDSMMRVNDPVVLKYINWY